MASIPVFKVSVPEYKLKKIIFRSGLVDHAATPWYNIKIPKAYWEKRPDFESIGRKIDGCLKKHFLGKRVAIRALGSSEHKGKSADEVIAIIKRLGHDHYNLSRKGDRYENIDNKKIDFFALDFRVKPSGEYFRQFVEPFYFWPIADREKPIKIDIAIVYDSAKLRRVVHRYKGRENEMKKDGFVFCDPEKKADAVLGIIKII